MIWRGRQKSTVELNVFDNYYVHVLRPRITKCGKPGKKNILGYIPR